MIEQLRKHIHIKLISNPKEAKCYNRKPTCQSFQIINEDLTWFIWEIKRFKWTSRYLPEWWFWTFPRQWYTIWITITFWRNFCPRKPSFSLPIRTVYSMRLKLVTFTMIFYWMQLKILTVVYIQNHICCSIRRIGRNLVSGNMKTARRDLFDNLLELERKCILYDVMTRNTIRWKQKEWSRFIVNISYVRHLVRALCKRTITSAMFWQIRSSVHNLKTVLIKKSALNPNDSKRFVLSDGVNTLAYGHYSLRRAE